MPHRLPDTLLPGESLRSGESLISLDGRFHLYLEEDGDLVAYAYSPTKGIKRFWRLGVSAGPDARLELDNIQLPLSPHYQTPAIVLKNKDGLRVWAGYSRGAEFRTTDWENLSFVMQSHGNIVQYVKSKTSGLVRYTFATDTYRLWDQIVAVPPNRLICEVPIAPGSLILSPDAGNMEIKNLKVSPIAVRAGTQVVGVPQNASVSVSMPGTLAISTTEYSFPDLRGADGTKPGQSSNACSSDVEPPRLGGRVIIEIGGEGACFSIRGQFDSPEFESLGQLFTTGIEEPQIPTLESHRDK